MTTPLSSAVLHDPPPGVAVPGYDRGEAAVGIVHFGVGAFHRAHQAMYVDRVLARGDLQWGICGVGVREEDKRIRDALAGQDNLYTLLTVAPDGSTETRVIGSILDYLYAPDDPDAVLARLVAPATRIVTLTITEGGYGISDDTGEFDPQDAGTLADLEDPAGPPRSVLGFLSAALRARRAAGTPPFTLVSCDNLPGNGDVARKALIAFAARTDPAHAGWIADNVAVPNSMVDRITPATTEEVGDELRTRYGLDDACPVRSETYEQWVLEDRFTLGRPAFDAVGVQLVPDAEPYELMKLRLLNASHQVLGHFGLLRGMTLVHEACQDPDIRTFLRGYMVEEAIPTLPPVPGVDLSEYCATLLSRFSSEAVRDTLARLAFDGSDRIAKFVLPVVRERVATGNPIRRCVLVVAAWSKVVEGLAASGDLNRMDRRAEQLRAAAAAEAVTPGAFLTGLPDILGDLSTDPVFVEAFVQARALIDRHGVGAALESVSTTAEAGR